MPKLPARVVWRLAPLALLALGVPSRTLAADPPEVTAGDGSATTLLVILLLGSLTAGLFFASPLRRRLARGSFASTRMPTGVSARFADSSAGIQLDRIARTVHDRLAQATARWPTLRTATPLPPMLGGDIFFEDEPQPAVHTAIAAAQAGPAARRPERPAPAAARGGSADTTAATPWSTAPTTADERYLPSR